MKRTIVLVLFGLVILFGIILGINYANYKPYWDSEFKHYKHFMKSRKMVQPQKMTLRKDNVYFF